MFDKMTYRLFTPEKLIFFRLKSIVEAGDVLSKRLEDNLALLSSSLLLIYISGQIKITGHSNESSEAYYEKRNYRLTIRLQAQWRQRKTIVRYAAELYRR